MQVADPQSMEESQIANGAYLTAVRRSEEVVVLVCLTNCERSLTLSADIACPPRGLCVGSPDEPATRSRAGTVTAKRLNASVLGVFERPALAWMSERVPLRISPDHLTSLGLAGAAAG